jgi:CRP-like cAMP-binding protein
MEKIPAQTPTHTTLPGLGPLRQLDETIRNDLAKAGTFSVLPVGTYLARQGEEHHTLSVIISGQASVTAHAHGDFVKLATLKAGETIGEMTIIDPHKASADVMITERAEVWAITEKEFEDFLERDPRTGCRVLKFLGKVLCRRLRLNSEKMLQLAEESRRFYRDNDY